MTILLATNNPAKVDRIRAQMRGCGFAFVTPAEAGIAAVEVEEGSDILENARAKAMAYAGKTDLPILGLDTAFVIPGEDLDPAKVKRNALGGRDERSLAVEEIAQAMHASSHAHRRSTRACGPAFPHSQPIFGRRDREICRGPDFGGGGA